MLEIAPSKLSTTPVLFALFAIVFATIWLQTYFSSSILSKIPGPFLARFTDFWRYLDVSKGNHHNTLLRLHSEHGKYVRIGPNTVSIADPELIDPIYGVNAGFYKGRFYDAFAQHSRGKIITSLFTERDDAIHAAIKKPVALAYSMNALLDYEKLVDNVIETMVEKLKSEFTSKTTVPICDMGSWLQYYSFDVITEISFSMSVEFLKKGSDIGDYIEKLDEAMDADAPISQLPWLGYLKKKNPMRSIFAQDSSFLPSFVKEQIERRVSDRASEVHSSNVAHSRDFLDKFLDAKYAHPEIVDDTMIWSYSMTNVGAGSDSVAIPLRTILYYVLRNLDVKDRLMDELRSSSLKLPPSFQKAKALTYLDAVIRESLRFHPPVGLGLERVTPKGGLSLECGILIAPGTQVSICPWVVNRDRHIFGSDADEFNPQRWLQSPGEALEDFRSRKRRMDKYDFTFGHGPRMCIGKNISLLEIYKLIPTLFLAFDMDIVSNEWKVQNSWFVRQEGLRVILKDL